jgi:hypothetical protein
MVSDVAKLSEGVQHIGSIEGDADEIADDVLRAITSYATKAKCKLEFDIREFERSTGQGHLPTGSGSSHSGGGAVPESSCRQLNLFQTTQEESGRVQPLPSTEDAQTGHRNGSSRRSVGPTFV